MEIGLIQNELHIESETREFCLEQADVVEDFNDAIMEQVPNDNVSELCNKTCGLEVEKQIGNCQNIEVVLPNLNSVDATGSLEGVRAETWQEFLPLYEKHASKFGFTFKKHTGRRDVNKKVYEKYLRCSCSGQTHRKENPKIKRKKNDTRTGCEACVRIKLVDGYFTVMKHVMTHNHPLTRPEWQHMHRIERNISKEKGEAMKKMDAAGIKPSAAFRYFVHTTGGEENVGHLKEDHLNYINRERSKMLDGNDAQCVIDELTKRRNEDPGFYFKPLLDKEGRLIALFWRDSRMKDDYLIYGDRDVVIFDTTYSTNRYDMICAPFVGVNNHWNNVMFGNAFIGNETADTFAWLLLTFLDSMDMKKPATIFTDQDAAMAKAIERVLGKETRHRLCLWHLYQNAKKHCGKLRKNKEFRVAFDHCLRGCVDRMEFELSWFNMIQKFELEDVDWFKRLYGLKEKWCTALSKDFFSAGILSTQRSESTNNAISYDATKTTSLYQFYQIFSNTVDRWRSLEKRNEFQSSWSTPRSEFPAGVIKHAAEVYTPTIFHYFEGEFKECLVSIADIEINMGSKKTYVVYLEDGGDKVVKYLVKLEKSDGRVQIICNCGNFEEVGWLCSHCLRVMLINNINKIPEQYIKKRWSKDAKKHVWDRIQEERVGGKPDCDMLNWREHMMRRFSELVIKSEADLDARRTVEEAYTATDLAIGEILSKEAMELVANKDIESTVIVGEKVLDPEKSKTKGRRGTTNKKNGKRKAVITLPTFDKPPPERLL